MEVEDREGLGGKNGGGLGTRLEVAQKATECISIDWHTHTHT